MQYVAEPCRASNNLRTMAVVVPVAAVWTVAGLLGVMGVAAVVPGGPIYEDEGHLFSDGPGAGGKAAEDDGGAASESGSARKAASAGKTTTVKGMAEEPIDR